jgi:Caspase domain
MIPRAVLIILLAMLLPAAGKAEKRVALVIGNDAYAKVEKLSNPTRDADAIEALFRKAGFEVVEVNHDLGLVAMRRALRNFSDRVHDADIAVIFFAGHGIEVNGVNYLIPVDAALERDTDVEDETISLERVTQMLEQAKRLRLIILDACRANPFVRSMKRTVASRSIGRGLAEVRVLTSDTLIAFAAKAGSTASDGKGTNSPYTTALVKHITTPGLDLRLALGRVRDEVLNNTANRQEPNYYGSLGGEEISLVAAIKPQQPAASSVSDSEARNAPNRTALAQSDIQAGGLFTEQHAKHVKALADKHLLIVPEFQIGVPAQDVPAHLRRFVGIWFDETGGSDGAAKKSMLIVTNVDKNGKADGYFAFGPPTAKSINRGAAGYFRIEGTINDDTLRFSNPVGTYRSSLTTSNRILYVFANAKGQTASRYLNSVWSLVEAERSAKR